jgi:hypothetical protein
VGGVITRDSLLADILQGIQLRNSVVHRGSREVQVDEVERFAGTVYFLIEAVLVNLPWEGYEPKQSQSSQVSGGAFPNDVSTSPNKVDTQT